MGLKIPAEDFDLTPDELDDKYSPHGGEDYPGLPRTEWKQAVAKDETILGYWAWVYDRISDENPSY